MAAVPRTYNLIYCSQCPVTSHPTPASQCLTLGTKPIDNIIIITPILL